MKHNWIQLQTPFSQNEYWMWWDIWRILAMNLIHTKFFSLSEKNKKQNKTKIITPHNEHPWIFSTSTKSMMLMLNLHQNTSQTQFSTNNSFTSFTTAKGEGEEEEVIIKKKKNNSQLCHIFQFSSLNSSTFLISAFSPPLFFISFFFFFFFLVEEEDCFSCSTVSKMFLQLFVLSWCPFFLIVSKQTHTQKEKVNSVPFSLNSGVPVVSKCCLNLFLCVCSN